MTRQTTQAGPGSEFFTRTRFIQPPVAKESLVAWYPFREGTGADITAGDSDFGDSTDYSATVNGATYQPSGGVTDIQTGANSGAFDFDGVDDLLTASNIPISGDITITCFVNHDSLSGFATNLRTLVAQGGFSSADWALYYNNPGSPNDLSDDTLSFTESGELAVAPVNYSTGTFASFTVRVRNGTTSLFQDGSKLTITNTSGTKNVQNTGQTTRIGYDNNKDRFTDGIIDGVRIYDAALSDSQINQIYLNTEP
jgi:hypothetical protein